MLDLISVEGVSGFIVSPVSRCIGEANLPQLGRVYLIYIILIHACGKFELKNLGCVALMSQPEYMIAAQIAHCSRKHDRVWR